MRFKRKTKTKKKGGGGDHERKHEMCPDLVKRLHGEVDAAAGGGQRQVLLRHCLHLCHDDIRLLHLPGHLSCLLLQVLQRGDDSVIIKDATFDLIEGLQQGFLQLTQTQLELTYKRQRTLLLH